MKRRNSRSFVPLLPRMWRTLLERPGTVAYPFGPLALSPHFRGRVVAASDQCRGCGACVRDCPASALELIKSKDRDSFILRYYADRCARCGQCETSCHFDVLSLISEFTRELVSAIMGLDRTKRVGRLLPRPTSSRANIVSCK